MGGEDGRLEDWGRSLSLKQPIHPHHHNSICKRGHHHEPLFSHTDEQSSKIQKSNDKIMKLKPRTSIGMEITNMKPAVSSVPLVIYLEDEEIDKLYSPSPDSTLTSKSICNRISGNLNGERNLISDDEDVATNGSGVGERKKLRLTKEQTTVLEQAFRDHSTVNTKQKLALARQVKLRPRQVEVWFQNRRARTKLKQTEEECEHLRKYCKNLREENMKLQTEVEKLRSLQHYPTHDSNANTHQLPTILAMSCRYKLY